MHNIPRNPLHPEPPRHQVLSPAEKMRKDRGDVRERREDDERAHECLECRLRTHVDAPENRHKRPAEDNGPEGIVGPLVDVGEEMAERCRSIAGQGPEDAAGGHAAADARDESRQEGKEQETDRPSPRFGRLPVDFGEGKEVGTAEDVVEIGDSVKDGDKIEEAAEAAKDILEKDGFRDVAAGTIRSSAGSWTSPANPFWDNGDLLWNLFR